MIQYDFATSAVDFLHRSGRTGRQGRPGRVTSLIGEAEEALGEAMEAGVKQGFSLEENFSRKRSFRKKRKKIALVAAGGAAGGAAAAQW